MMMAYYSNLMAMTLDLMAYLKNNDGNALRYYLRSAKSKSIRKSQQVWARKTRVNRSSLILDCG